MLILILTAGAELLALMLRLTARKKYAAWILGLGTLPALVQMTVEFSQGAQRGAAMTKSDEQFLAAELGILLLALLSFWRYSSLFFWLGWTANLALTGIFVYLVFFWRLF